VRDTQGRDSDGDAGDGLGVQDGGQVTVQRCRFDRNRSVGVQVVDADSSLELTDVVVADTASSTLDQYFGYGLSAAGGSRLTASRVVVMDNRCTGVFVAEPTTRISLSDVVVRDTRSCQSDGTFGNGLQVQEGAQVTVLRGLFQRNRYITIMASFETTALEMTDIVIRDALPAEFRDTCALCAGGQGVVAAAGGSIVLNRFVVSNNAVCGVQLVHGRSREVPRWPVGGTIDLHDGEVSHNPIGVNVQTEGFDLARLMDRVLYFDNLRNLDASDLPVPEISGFSGGELE
jgi:hypothetical protein